MANLTAAANPELVLEMQAMERTTPAHCDEWNRRHQQLLDNDKFLHEKMKNVFVDNVSDGELRETQTANYFSNLYPIDCAVPAVNACSCRKCGALQSVWIPI